MKVGACGPREILIGGNDFPICGRMAILIRVRMSEAAEEGEMGKWDEIRRGIFRASVVGADDNASLLPSLGKRRIADEKSCERGEGGA